MGLVSGIIVHHMVDDVPTIAGSVIRGSVRDVDLGLELEMVLHLGDASGCGVGRVAAFNA